MESLWKLMQRREAPLLNRARIKFLGLNLDYSIEKATQRLGYCPSQDFSQAMPATVKAMLAVSNATGSR
jgi:hypothetical protein